MEISIGKSKIGDNYPTFIVAEMSANHGHDLNKATELVYAAKEAGANAIKLQTYTADTITIKSDNKDFKISNKSPWKKYKNLWNLYNHAKTPMGWHKQIFAEAKKLNLD